MEDPEATALNSWELVLQELHIEIEAGVYLGADGNLLVYNNIIEEKWDSSEETEPEESDETSNKLTFKENG